MHVSPNDSETITGINVTPLVDIVLVLLIIFMASAPLMQRKAMNVSLPKAAKSERVATQTMRLEFNAQRQLRLDGRRLSEPDLARELARVVELQPAAHVAVAADEAIPYGEVISLLDLIKTSGVKRIGLEVRRK